MRQKYVFQGGHVHTRSPEGVNLLGEPRDQAEAFGCSWQAQASPFPFLLLTAPKLCAHTAPQWLWFRCHDGITHLVDQGGNCWSSLTSPL